MTTLTKFAALAAVLTAGISTSQAEPPARELLSLQLSGPEVLQAPVQPGTIAPPQITAPVVPAPAPPAELDGIPQTAIPEPAPRLVLFRKVKYEDLDNVHPHAIHRVVAVPDPCVDPRHHVGPIPCVYVLIAVPPYGRPEIDVSHHGREIEFDYGEYEVDIEVKKGYIVVNYDD